ncbi:MAG: hypothetical protein HYZ35_03550 [Chloroflexi bacterium]|nr:hypothetical protein [Chloroflexota bacterium]
MAGTSTAPRTGNLWSFASLVLGVTSLIFSLIAWAPFIPAVSLLSWPLGLCAMASGWVGEKRACADRDPAATGQAHWGRRLGCLAWIIEGLAGVVFVLMVGGLVGVGLAIWFKSLTHP